MADGATKERTRRSDGAEEKAADAVACGLVMPISATASHTEAHWAVEAYTCEVMAGDGVTVLRSFDTTAPSQTYSATDFATDFPAGLPDTLTLRVRQRSAINGLGAPLQRTLWL